MSKRMAPLSVRITPELKARLEKSAARLGIAKHTLAQMAIEAAVDAVAQNDYKLVVPIKFDVRDVPAVRGMKYPERKQYGTIEDRARAVEEQEADRIRKLRKSKS